MKYKLLLLPIICIILTSCSINNLFINPNDYKKLIPYEYYVYAPSNYTEDHIRPVFVFIHGSGGSGLDCWNLFQKYADDEGYVLVCPSIADEGGGWYQQDGNNKLLAILNQVHKDYFVRNQIYLAGFSAGGQFVQGFTISYPQYVAAVSIIAPGNNYDITAGEVSKTFYIMVGDQDNPDLINGAEQLANSMKANRLKVSYFLIPGIGHQINDREIELTLELYRQKIK
jgi:predicted esterase